MHKTEHTYWLALVVGCKRGQTMCVRKMGIIVGGIIVTIQISLPCLKKNKHLVELGNQIRELRKARGLSQEQLAFTAEVDRSYVGGVERGERNVSFLTLVKIAECLNCDVCKFTKGIPHD